MSKLVSVVITGMCLLLLQVMSEEDGKQRLFKKFQQNGYHVVVHRVVLERYNHKYLSYADIRSFKYNRTNKATNATGTLRVDVNNSLTMILQAYKMMSNEYRYFPLRLQIDVCDILDNNIAGAKKFMTCGNFTGCPIKKGTYHICNFLGDETKYPPLIPAGDYKLEYQFLYNGTELLVFGAFGSVVWPFLMR